MGPALVRSTKIGRFDLDAWRAAAQAADARDFDQTLAAIAAHGDEYAREISTMTDADFRAEIEMFGNKTTKGAFIVNLVLGGCAAYRTQLFLSNHAGARTSARPICGRASTHRRQQWRADRPAGDATARSRGRRVDAVHRRRGPAEAGRYVRKKVRHD
jgi:hypothetical protein